MIPFFHASSNRTKKADPLVIVQSRNGRIKGKNLSEDVRAWLGVPYAEPPVGRYRFSRPRQIKAWDRDVIKDAITYPNACSQMPDEFFGNFSGSLAWNPNTNVSEDCLYLNVFAPRDIEENEVIGKVRNLACIKERTEGISVHDRKFTI